MEGPVEMIAVLDPGFVGRGGRRVGRLRLCPRGEQGPTQEPPEASALLRFS